jgi:ABC-2 type transport system ATP-binding protein
VVLTTHYMEEAEVLSHRVGIVDAGRMVALDTSAGLISQYADGHRIEFSVDAPTDPEMLADLAGVSSATFIGNGVSRYRLVTSEPNLSVPALYRWAEETESDLFEVGVHSATLEDVFLAVTGRSLRD